MWSNKRAWASLILAAGLSACSAVGGLDNSKIDPRTPTENYKLSVEQRPEQVALRPHVGGLSPAQRDALADFVARWRAAGAGEITIETPSTGADPSAISRTAADTLAQLQAMGAPSTSLSFAAYDAAGASDAPVIARFTTLALKRDDCSKNWDNLVSTGANGVTSHFGCAMNSNIAMQIARPQDVLTPAADQPADAVRRENVLTIYRKGEVTSAKRDEQAAGAISSGLRQ